MPRRVFWLIVALVLGHTAAARAQTIEYYALDAVGSVRVVFDASGTILGRMDYGPFGQELIASTGKQKNVYAGLFAEGEAGLGYAEARMYQPRTGRFNAPDPIYAGLFDPQQWNRYSYARNSPAVYSDPSGLILWFPSSGCNSWSYTWEDAEGKTHFSSHVCQSAGNDGGGGGSSIDFDYGMWPWYGGTGSDWGTSRDEPHSGFGTVLNRVIENVGQTILAVLDTVLQTTPVGAPHDGDTVDTAYKPPSGAAGAILVVGGLTRGKVPTRWVSAGGRLIPVPKNWTSKIADNRRGIVYQAPGATGNANMIRIGDPDRLNPAGYVRIYNADGQPIVPWTGQPGPDPLTHIPLTYNGQILWPW